MLVFEILGKNRASVAAIALLGFAELLFIDMTASYVRIANLGGSGLLFSATALVSIFSAIIICWAVIKQQPRGSTTDLSNRTSGPLVGAPTSRSHIREGRVAVQPSDDKLVEGVQTGTLVALLGAVIICAAMLLAGLFGRGVGRLLPQYLQADSAIAAAAVYGALCLFTLFFYAAAGAVLGAGTALAMSMFGRKRKAGKIQLQAKKKTSGKN